MLVRLFLLFLISFFTACSSVGPKYEKPVVELPEDWSVDATDNQGVILTDNTEVKEQWWKVYNDSVLDQLVEEALAHNANIALAVARVEEARAELRGRSSEHFPTIDLAASHDRTRLSERSSTPLPSGSNIENNNTRVTVNISYELDLWGRLRQATEAARAELLASEAAHDTVRIALTADIVKTYFTLRALEEQLEATRRALTTRSETLELQRKRLEVGDISEFDFRQQEAEVAAARAQLPVLERQYAQAESALSVLLGRSPKAIFQDRITVGRDDESLSLAVVVPANLPSELLLRRPDLIEAEQRLIAANARIAVARTGYFPRISLTGYLGSESKHLTDLFTGPAGIWQAAINLLQPLFGGDRVRSQVAAAGARERQALAQYHASVQNAFSEVRVALIAQTKARDQFDAEQQRVQALTQALRLARLRYQNGIASQLDVLDAERSMLTAELSRIDALRLQRAAIADLFKALGG